MVTQKERVSASIVILQQMVSPCGLIAVLPPIFRMVTLFRMVAFIPAHRPEAYALTKKYARMETALLQTFVVHHIPSTFPMEQLHCRARLAHKYIHVTLSRLQIHLPDLPTHTIHAHAHISMMLRRNYMVVLIQMEHNFFEGQRKTVSTKWKRRLVSDGCDLLKLHNDNSSYRCFAIASMLCKKCLYHSCYFFVMSLSRRSPHF